MPIEVAKELYVDLVGKDDIRVDGCAGGAPPENRAVWLIKGGTKVLSSAEQLGYLKYKKDFPSVRLYDKEPVFSDYPESIGAKQYVTTYHIDSEVGLRIFADALRAHDLISEATTV